MGESGGLIGRFFVTCEPDTLAVPETALMPVSDAFTVVVTVDEYDVDRLIVRVFSFFLFELDQGDVEDVDTETAPEKL
ncbi:hypothetical protein [Zhihengliuella halotolerans]|uniref:hypothetical protein n=1 Tax=Zhihengliuella halotolerans TaxID=370736 RepID=UPI00102C6651|nr:hypothetical protein [Zhihengliuella halotolerans]